MFFRHHSVLIIQFSVHLLVIKALPVPRISACWSTPTPRKTLHDGELALDRDGWVTYHDDFTILCVRWLQVIIKCSVYQFIMMDWAHSERFSPANITGQLGISESQGWYCQISFNINFVFPYFALQKLTQTFAGRPIQSFCYPEQPQDQIYGEPHFSVAFIFSSKQVTYSGHWSWFPAPHRQWLLQYSIVNDSGCWAQP